MLTGQSAGKKGPNLIAFTARAGNIFLFRKISSISD
jgi:hypothetical protein